MTAGIEVFNTKGSLQITEGYKTIHLMDKFTIGNDGHVPFTAGNLIAFRAEGNGWATIYPGYIDELGAISGNLHFRSTVPITIYKFGYITLPHGNFLEIYDANGNLTFTDGAPPLRVITPVSGAFTIWGRESNGAQISVTPHSPDYKAAVVLGTSSSMVGFYNTEGTYGKFNATMGFTFNANNVTSNVVVLRDYDRVINQETRYPSYNFMLVDVTNY